VYHESNNNPGIVLGPDGLNDSLRSAADKAHKAKRLRSFRRAYHELGNVDAANTLAPMIHELEVAAQQERRNAIE